MLDGIIEIISRGVFKGIFEGAKLVGLFTLKTLTANKESMEEFKKKYQGSIKPYLIGFSCFIGIIYLLIKLID